jgi:hypothetical protein
MNKGCAGQYVSTSTWAVKGTAPRASITFIAQSLLVAPLGPLPGPPVL